LKEKGSKKEAEGQNDSLRRTEGSITWERAVKMVAASCPAIRTAKDPAWQD